MKPEHKKALDALWEAHGKVAHAVIENTLYAFKAPSQDEWEEHQSRLEKEKLRGPVWRSLALLCCVTHTTEEIAELFEKYPGLPVRIADAISDLVGADIEFTVKKD